MCFSTDRAKAHRPGREALNNIGSVFDLVQIDSRAFGGEFKQTTQSRFAGVFLVNALGKCPVSVFAVCSGCRLQVGYGFRVPQMNIAGAAPMKISRIRQYRNAGCASAGESEVVTANHFVSQCRQVYAGNATGRAFESELDNVFGQAHSFKDLCAFIRVQG